MNTLDILTELMKSILMIHTNSTNDDIQEDKIDDLEELIKKNNEIKYKKIKI